MKKVVAFFALACALAAVPSHAEVTFEYLFDGPYTPQDQSDDGSVVVGYNLSESMPFRWTQATGVVYLGRAMDVGQGGFCRISANGQRIAASIGSVDSSYSTWGIWSQATGWQELMPPVPPEGGTTDGSYGSVYDLSGDGNSVVGLFWRPGVGRRAHAAKWTSATGVFDLGFCASGQASRANGTNHNGTVTGGWVEMPQGYWRPAVWANGTHTLLTEVVEDGVTTPGTGEVKAVSPDGNILVGFCLQPVTRQRAAAMWKRVNGVWQPTEFLGFVDGTEPVRGINVVNAVSADGRIAAGYCSYDGSPFSSTGFVWTQANGLQEVNEFLMANGVFPDQNFTIQNIVSMTPDGTKIIGFGQMTVAPFTKRAFRIRITGVTDAPVATPVAKLRLSAPRPNPSRGESQLDLSLPVESDVDLSVFDAAGRRVATLLSGVQAAGRQTVMWDGRESNGRPAAAGLYFARVHSVHGSATQRLVRVN